MQSPDTDATAEILSSSCDDAQSAINEIVQAIESGEKIPDEEKERALGSIHTILHVLDR